MIKMSLFNLIDLYIKSNKNAEAQKYIKVAKKLIRIITVCILQPVSYI